MKTGFYSSRFTLIGLGISLATATVFSSFASARPDGLERVATDLAFDHRATQWVTFPGSQWLADYEFNGVPPSLTFLATPIAGGIGTLTVFGIAWGVGTGIKSTTEKTPSNLDDGLDME